MVETAIDVSLDLAADFADFGGALQGMRQREALVARAWHAVEDGAEGGGTLTLRYSHPGLDLAVGIRLSGGTRGSMPAIGSCAVWSFSSADPPHRDETRRTEVEVLGRDGLTILRPRAIPRGHDRITTAMRVVLAPSTANRL